MSICSCCARIALVLAVLACGCVRGSELSGLEAAIQPADAASDASNGSDLLPLRDHRSDSDVGTFCTCAAADVDNNGGVGGSDHVVFSNCWEKPPEGYCASADIDKDGAIGQADWDCVMTHWGSIC